ncbi:MAG: 3TM-type holin [Cyclobacteriaceae bacterium]
MPAIFQFIEKIFKPAADLIDEVVTSKEEKLVLRNELARMQREVIAQMLTYEQQLMHSKASVIQGKGSDTWLQRSWRPILMLSFGFIIIYQYFISHALRLPIVDLPQGFWALLEIGVGGYVIGRSLEKISPNLAEAIKGRKKATTEHASPIQSMSVTPPLSSLNVPPPAQPKAPSYPAHDLLDEKLSRREERLRARRRRGEERRRRRGLQVES